MPKQSRVSERGRASARAALLSLCALLAAAPHAPAAAQKPSAAKEKPAARPARPGGRVPQETLLRIMAAEDERRWEETDLGALLRDASAAVRRRAALAAGRIGDEGAVTPLSALLNADRDESVRATAAFALGEIEAEGGTAALLESLRLSKSAEVRARAVEALGKIAAALPEARADAKKRIGVALAGALAAEQRLAKPNRALVLLGLTAMLRARPEGGERTVALFLSSTDARVRADALNTLARARAKESLERVRAILAADTDPVARANAARVLGAAEDAAAFDVLVAHAGTDADSRVRVSAVRALAQLKGVSAADPLVRRGGELFAAYKSARVGGAANPPEANELLEVATALGRVLQNSNDERAVTLLRAMRDAGVTAAEVETALARIAPTQYLRDRGVADLVSRVSRPGDTGLTWQKVSAVAQGLGEMAGVTSAQVGNSVVSLQADAQIALRDARPEPAHAGLGAARPAALARGLQAGRPRRGRARRARGRRRHRARRRRRHPFGASARRRERASAGRGAAARAPGSRRTTRRSPSSARSPSSRARTRRPPSVLRWRRPTTSSAAARPTSCASARAAPAAARRVETVNTRNHREDYERAAARMGKSVRAVISTDKGAVTLELLPEEAPLTVDNFVQLARRNYFNGVLFHRVVPNFVVQGGDPRGDGNGGPGYQIRCEINTVPYARGAVGMALSGKDTGGSQWFVTHSPQPHLDGGYTVFGRVVEGMEVVDRIVRGDRIRSVTITERGR